MDEIVNKVAKSGLVTFDFEEHYPDGVRKSLDIKDQLWMGMALKEKDFREFISSHDWSQYKDAFVNVYCSVDAIIPHWAFMLISTRLSGIAKEVYFGTAEEMERLIFRKLIDSIQEEDYRDVRVVVKGCGNKFVPTSAYADLALKLQPVVKSLMFGEPCSTVPIFKK
jgi:S-adenosylmethionine/arginine decarboxylase-like enzyme